MSESYDGPALADALARARNRIERDEALLKRAAESLGNARYFIWLSETGNPDEQSLIDEINAILRDIRKTMPPAQQEPEAQ